MGNKSSAKARKGKHLFNRATDKEIDLRKESDWNPKHMWICDIKEKANESDCDFLFLADIQPDGNAEKRKTLNPGKCIFQNNMYDLNEFEEDSEYDGKLDFTLRFGQRKIPNMRDEGWSVQFKQLSLSSEGRSGQQIYTGIVVTSWWGERQVRLINYDTATAKEKLAFPDLIVPKSGYFKTLKSTPPPPLPHGWTQYTDDKTGLMYYYNAKTQTTVWDRPR